MQRPSIRFVHKSELHTAYILTKRNYKVDTNIGKTVGETKRFAGVLENRAAFSVVRLSELPRALRATIRKPDDIPDARNASGKSISIVGTIELIVQIGTST